MVAAIFFIAQIHKKKACRSESAGCNTHFVPISAWQNANLPSGAVY